MFYNNLKTACDKLGLKITPTVLECGGKNGSATNWKKGAIPNSDIVIKLAEYLNVSTDYLLLGKEFSLTEEQQSLLNDFERLSGTNKHIIMQHIQALTDLQENENKVVTIKHSIHKVSAGFGEALYEADNFEDISVYNSDIVDKADFALTVDGDSMIPKFYPDDVILVKQQDAVDIGEICVYIVNNEGFVKKYGGDRLISLNPKYEDILFEEYSPDEIICCGLVLGKAQIIN